MNNLVPFHQYNPLNEGISPVLYHFTYPTYTLHMLAENRIHCSSTLGTSSDRKGFNGNFFYFSMQTSKNSRNGYGGATRSYKKDGTIGGGRSVCWVVDGAKLQQRHAGKAVDYWSGLRDPHKADGDEMEERVIIEKPYIEKANQYIKELHVALGKGQKYDERMVELCAMRNIPVYHYTDAVAFENHWKEKAVELSSLESFRSEEEVEGVDNLKDRDIATVVAILCYKDDANRAKLTALFPDNVFPEYIEQRISEFQRLYYNNPYNIDELGQVAETALKMNRATTSSIFRVAVVMLTNEMRKMNVPNVTEYLYRKSGHRKAPDVKPAAKEPNGLYYNGYLQSWNERAWKYLDFYEVNELLPEAEGEYAFSNKLKNDNVSIETVYKFLVKRVGRTKTHEFFAKNDLEIIKGTSW